MTETFGEATEFITQCLDELAAAQDLWGVEAPPPGPCYAKLNEAATTLQRAVSRLIILTGEANQLSVQQAIARGERCCATCFHWVHESRMAQHVIERKPKQTAAEKEDGERNNNTTWWTCREPCK